MRGTCRDPADVSICPGKDPGAHGKPIEILFLTDNFPPEVNAPASRTFEHAREWVRAGHRVTVITCAPNHPLGKVFGGYKNKLFFRESMDGVDVVRVWTYMSANAGVVRRTLDYLSYMFMATLASLFVRRPDVVVATSPQFFTACAGYMVSRLRRRPFVFELRDLWPESIEAVTALKSGAVLRMIGRIERFLYEKASAIVAVTKSFRDILQQRGIHPAKIHVVTNGADLVRYSPRERREDLALALGCHQKFVAGYIGTHGMAHSLDTLLRAALILQEQHAEAGVIILFVGDGAMKSKIRAAAFVMGLTNVRFVDTVPKDEIADYWSILDVSIVHLRRAALFESVIPSKIFESFAMGIPVLLGVRGEARVIVEELQAGFCFEPEDAQELANWLVALSTNSARLEDAKRGCATGAISYSRTRLAARMLQVLVGVARGGCSEAATEDARQEGISS